MDHVFERHYQKAKEWLDKIVERLGVNDRQALTLFKAVTHAIRDRLPVDEAFQLGAQFPALLKGFYYEGYSTNNKPEKMLKAEDFYRKVQEQCDNIDLEPEVIVRTIITILKEKVSEGEISDISSNFPKDMKFLLE